MRAVIMEPALKTGLPHDPVLGVIQQCHDHPLRVWVAFYCSHLASSRAWARKGNKKPPSAFAEVAYVVGAAGLLHDPGKGVIQQGDLHPLGVWMSFYNALFENRITS
ncbi:MAG: hypothetical protein GC193_14045 [Cryomorphaceae bacterium]|nr:hypothetical protein [Cryomorphaceae bacterium]